MEKELKSLLDSYKIDQIYNNNLFSIKSISEFLGTWDNYSSDEKYKIENITKIDSTINKNFTYDGNYNTNLIYGEITKKGVDILIEKIKTYKKITDKDIFIDVGSGCGKLILHTAIRSNIKTLIGVEILKERYEYANYIKSLILPESKSIFFIKKDILDFDVSIGTIVFVNAVSLNHELTNEVYKNLQKGCHLITTDHIPEYKLLKEKFKLNVSWLKNEGIEFNYYIK